MDTNNTNADLIKQALKITNKEVAQNEERNKLIDNINKIIKKINIILDNKNQDFDSINILTNESIKLNNLLVNNSNLLLKEEGTEIIQLLTKIDNIIKNFILKKTGDVFMLLNKKGVFSNYRNSKFATFYLNNMDNFDIDLSNLTDKDYSYLNNFLNKVSNLYTDNQDILSEIEKNNYLKIEYLIRKIFEAKDAFNGLFEEDEENN